MYSHARGITCRYVYVYVICRHNAAASRRLETLEATNAAAEESR